MKPGAKRTLLIISGTLITALISAQWTLLPVPTRNNLNSISVFDETNGWIVGDHGTMLYLEGESWKSYPPVTDQNLLSVYLLNSSDGWAVGTRGTILNLQGKKWTKVESPTHQDLYSVCFSTEETGYAVGNNGTFLIYKNGVWEMTEHMTPAHLYAVAILNERPFIAGGRENITIPIMSVETGEKYRFTRVHDPGYYEITGLAMPEPDAAWAVGKPGIILHKHGNLWEKVDMGERLPSLTGVYFASEESGITVGYGGTILTYSSDGWQKEDTPLDSKLNGTFIFENKYYAVGDNGTVLAGLRSNSMPPNGSHSPYPLAISSFPNPASGLINLNLPDKPTVNAIVSVLNSRGQAVIIKALDNGNQGDTYQINTSGLSNGLYIVNIVSGGQIVASGKFIVKN